MTNDSTAPITINSNPAASQVMTALRTFATALVAYAAGKGWIDATLGTAGAGLVLVLLPAAWSQFASLVKQQRLVAVAAAAPNSVAVVK